MSLFSASLKIWVNFGVLTQILMSEINLWDIFKQNQMNSKTNNKIHLMSPNVPSQTEKSQTHTGTTAWIIS